MSLDLPPWRTDLTVQDGQRIDHLMEESGLSHSTVGHNHDPYGQEATTFDVTSPLAKFLMRKGLLKPNQEIGVAKKRCFVHYEVDCAQVWASAQYAYGMGCRKWRIRRIAIG